MRYQTTNLRARTNPLRSIALVRHASVLGLGFSAPDLAAARAHAAAEYAVSLAKHVLAGAEEAYGAARRDLGEANRRLAKGWHAAALFPLVQRKEFRRQAFVRMNRARGEISRAKKTLAAAQAALMGSAH